MKAIVIMNGTLKIVLTGATELEKQALKEMCKVEIEITEIKTPTPILNEIIQDGLYINPKKVHVESIPSPTDESLPK